MHVHARSLPFRCLYIFFFSGGIVAESVPILFFLPVRANTGTVTTA